MLVVRSSSENMRQRLLLSVRLISIFCAIAIVLVAPWAHGAPPEAQLATSAPFEHHFVVGAGAALEAVSRGSSNVGGSAFIEWEAVDEWLEVELGVAALSAEGGVEVPIGLLFKKPFRLSRRTELMVGLGPELLAYRRTHDDGQFLALEIAADLMFWVTSRVGVSVEPSYELAARGEGERSLAGTGGVIFGW